MNAVTHFMLCAVWLGMLGGVVSGAVIGLFFAREDWMGGYGGWRRRLTRLGHISFFGLAFVNLAFAVTNHIAGLPAGLGKIAAAGFVTGAITMPLFCFLSAWRMPFRHGFAIPVCGVLTGVLCTLTALCKT